MLWTLLSYQTTVMLGDIEVKLYDKLLANEIRT